MKIIVCGAGMVGKHIARYLSSEGNDVTVVDMDADIIRQITDQYDLKGVVGFASHPDVLETAGARDADMIIAATYSDEVNMVICQIAHSIFDITDKIARLRTDSYTNAIYADMYRRDHLPVDVVISPEKAVATAIARRLRKSSAFDNESFLRGGAQFIGLRIDDTCPIVNTPLKQLGELFSTFKGIVMGIRRDGELMVPSGNDQIFYGDEVYLMTTSDDEERAYEIFGKENHRVGHIVIIGGGEISYGVAKILEEESKVRIKIIERDRMRAEELSDQLSRSVILNGDGLDPILLKEANISQADTVLAITDDDKVNLLSAARAKAMGADHAISIVNDTTLDDLGTPLGIDTIINPRTITVSSILQHIRHGRIHAVYVVGENEAEVIEAQVLATSPLNGKKIRDIDWPEGSIIGAIRKAGEVVIAKSDTRLDDGDWVTIMALRGEVSNVEKLFQVTLDYF